VSYKPQKISAKFPGTVRQILHKRIRSMYMHPQFSADVMKPLKIDDIIDQSVSHLTFRWFDVILIGCHRFKTYPVVNCSVSLWYCVLASRLTSISSTNRLPILIRNNVLSRRRSGNVIIILLSP
jgi:hypothetical protein